MPNLLNDQMRRHHVVTTVLENQPKEQLHRDQSSADWWEENWAKNVFTDEILGTMVSPDIFQAFKAAVKAHKTLSAEVSNAVAGAMRGAWKGKLFCDISLSALVVRRLGSEARRHSLHPLVPALARYDCRKARVFYIFYG